MVKLDIEITLSLKLETYNTATKIGDISSVNYREACNIRVLGISSCQRTPSTSLLVA